MAPRKKTDKKEPTQISTSFQNNESSNIDFHFSLRKIGQHWSVILQHKKGVRINPDYRRYTGTVRNALREFATLLKNEEHIVDWNFCETELEEMMVRAPGPRFIDLAASCSLLYTPENQIVCPVPGQTRCVLTIQNLEQERLYITPQIITDDFFSGETEIRKNTTYALSHEHVVMDEYLYKVADLGPLWMDWDVLTTTIHRGDLEAYLALALSRFTNLDLHYPGYVVKRGELRATNPALFFKEIDAYGYLHIKPLAYLPGFPPGFFEDQEIVRIVEIDSDERTLRIDEVVFSEPPEDTFRTVLAKMGKEAKTSVYEEAGNFIIEPDFAKRFLQSNMSAILSQFILLQASLLSKYQLRLVKPKLRLSLGKGIDYFEGDANIDLDGQLFSFGRFMEEYHKKGFIMLNSGDRVYPNSSEMQRFERLLTKIPGSDASVGVSFFDLPALSKNDDIAVEGEGWQRTEKFLKGLNTINTKKGDFAINTGKLRPYQIYGVKWLEYLRDHGFGACLADEMGLGKTVEVISLLRRTYASGTTGPSLIIVPRSLVYNWKAELQRFAPELECVVYYGSDRTMETIENAGSSIILSSYATIRNDIKTLRSQEFIYVILDESQNIKNLETRTTAAVLSLKAKHRLALSGTPIENNLGDLYSLFRFLNPAFFGGHTDFLQRYLRPIQEKKDKEALTDLRARVYPFMLRRIKMDVLADLPPKTEQTAYIELDPKHMALYHKRRLELKEHVTQAVGKEGIGKSSFLILQALTELRRLAGIPENNGEYDGVSAKREYLKDMVSEIASEGHKCLIFTNYLASVDLIADDLESLGIRNLVMTGATGSRQELVHRFQTDAEIKAFIMTLKTGGLGLNLTAADYVFIFDPWWNRAAESQAIDRTHRIGQINPVFCYRMIARGTIEEKILELQETKVGLVSSLLSVDTNAIKTLTEDDITRLLG